MDFTIQSFREWDAGHHRSAGLLLVQLCRDFPEFIPALFGLRYLWLERPGLFDPSLMMHTTINSPTLCFHTSHAPPNPAALKDDWGFKFGADLMEQTLLNKAKSVIQGSTEFEISHVCFCFCFCFALFAFKRN